MQIEVFSKRSYQKTKGSLYFIFTSFGTHFSKVLSSYISSRCRIFFYFLHPFKESNVSSFVDTVNFTILSEGNSIKGIFIYIQRLLKLSFEKNMHYILPVCHTKSFFWPAKIERARRKSINCTLIYDFSVLNLFS